MISALYRYPKSVRRKMASVWGKRSAAALGLRRIELGVDADTLRRRALADARGLVLREGRTYHAGGVVHWIVRRTVRGRVEQRDVLIDRRLWRTCGPRRLPAWLR